MNQLPPGWRWSTIGEAGRVQLGRQRHPDWHNGPNMHPYLRVANVFEDHIDTTDVKQMDFTNCFERYKLEIGDVLLNEGQSPEFLGRPAIYRGIPRDAAFTNTLIRFQASPDVTPEWALTVFRHYMHSGRFARESRITTNIAHLSASRLKSVEFPIPPLEEQQRIVTILDDHLSHLNAAAAYLDAARRRARTWKEATADGLIWGPGFETRRVGDLLREPMRNGRSDRVATGGGTRCLTLTAVTRNEFTEENTKLTGTPPSAADGLWLEPGDIFVQRSNTPDLVGTTALFDGPRNWAIFPDLLIRLRPDEEVVDGRYLCAALRAERTHRTLRARAKGLSGSMPKIDQATIAETLVPLPPRERQADIIRALDEFQQSFDILNAAVKLENKRTLSLRRSLLAAAFSGELTPGYEPKEEVA